MGCCGSCDRGHGCETGCGASSYLAAPSFLAPSLLGAPAFLTAPFTPDFAPPQIGPSTGCATCQGETYAYAPPPPPPETGCATCKGEAVAAPFPPPETSGCYDAWGAATGCPPEGFAPLAATGQALGLQVLFYATVAAQHGTGVNARTAPRPDAPVMARNDASNGAVVAVHQVGVAQADGACPRCEWWLVTTPGGSVGYTRAVGPTGEQNFIRST